MKSGEKLIQAVCLSGMIETEGTISMSEFKRQKTQELKEKWKGKRMYGKFIRETPEKVDMDKTWNWLVRSDSKHILIAWHESQHIGSSHWSYSGINGPSHWAEEYPNCGKSRQSPINIVTRRTLYRRRRLENNYDEMPSDLRFSLANNGHSAQVTLSNTGNLHLHVFEHGDSRTSNGNLKVIDVDNT
eukprot:gene15102-6281_t